MGVRQRCEISLWLLDTLMDGCVRLWGLDESVVSSLFVNDTVLLTESAREFKRAVDEYYKACLRTKLKVNVWKIKVMVFERIK